MTSEERRSVSPHAFAQAMLDRDAAFAGRVRAFEEEFGEVDADLAAVLAQAAYLCATSADFVANLAEVCRAIGLGRPTGRVSHCQVTIERWLALHAYVVGLRRWLGDMRQTPEGVDETIVTRVAEWLGEPSLGKAALAEICLCRLLDAMHDVTVTAIGDVAGESPPPRSDLDAWRTVEGEPYVPAMRGKWLERAKTTARAELRERLATVDELIESVLGESPPPCHIGFVERLETWIAGVGALEWGGAASLEPEGRESRLERERLWEGEVRPFLTEEWPEGKMPRTELTWALHKALGPPISIRRAIVADFLLEPPPSDADRDWLRERSAR